jgi:hypothetical protein
MPSSSNTHTNCNRSDPCLVAARVAPEDLRIDDRVAILNQIVESPSWLWSTDCGLQSREEPVRIRFSSFEPGVPYRVKAICLPFVVLKRLQGERRVIDVRRFELVRLSNDFADAVKSGGRSSSDTS